MAKLKTGTRIYGSGIVDTTLLVGVTTLTGTANQNLQVTGGAYVSGNLGVGITNPTYKLHTTGNIKATTSLHFGTGGTYEAGTIYSDANWGVIIRALRASPAVADFLFTNSADTQRLRIDTSGNVIIPGNLTATGTSSQPLQVTGGAYFSGNVGVGITNPIYGVHIQGTSIAEIGFTATGSGGDNFRVGSGSIAAGFDGLRVYDVNAAAERLRVDSSGNVVINSTSATGTASQRLQVTGGAYVSGNLGIGTTNPSNTLTVYGTQSDTTPILALLSGNQQVGFNNGAQIAFGYDGTTTYQHFIQTRHNSGNSNNAIDFYVSDGTQNNTLTSGSVHTMSLVSGSVGINSTAPTSKLDVVGNAKFTGVVTATSFVKSGGTSSQFLKADGSVDTNTYLTSYTETDTIDSVLGRGNSTTKGISVGILTATSGNFSGIITSSSANISGIVTASGIGIGTTNATEALTLSGKIQINQNSTSDNRLIFRGQPSSSYRWNIDNYGSSNEFRIFREDDATSANGSVAVSISTTGTVTATKFSGDGSLLTGITAAGSGVVVQNQDSTVGTANTLNFSTNLTASFASGTATISLSNNPSITGILTADQVYTSNNGNGTNVRIGDDFWVGDINVANTTRFSGAQDSTKAFVVFGSSDAVALGRTGTGPLYYGGNFNVAGVSSATSFSGSGTNLTGIVTSIVAGTNITVSGSTGQVTINSTATGSGAALDILEVMLFA